MSGEKTEKSPCGKLKTVNIVLFVLLIAALAVLTTVWIYGGSRKNGAASAEARDNVITDLSEDAEDAEAAGTSKAGAARRFPRLFALAAHAAEGDEVALSLNSEESAQAVPFHVENMFPGDSVSKAYKVTVSHKSDLAVLYSAAVRPGYEKLAEVLKLRIQVSGDGGEALLYDGVIGEMPQSLSHEIYASAPRDTVLRYDITAYLETSVGNEYMEQSLVADFKWCVEDEGALEPPPKTGDVNAWAAWLSAAAALALAAALLKARRSGRAKNEEEE